MLLRNFDFELLDPVPEPNYTSMVRGWLCSAPVGGVLVVHMLSHGTAATRNASWNASWTATAIAGLWLRL